LVIQSLPLPTVASYGAQTFVYFSLGTSLFSQVSCIYTRYKRPIIALPSHCVFQKSLISLSPTLVSAICEILHK